MDRQIACAASSRDVPELSTYEQESRIQALALALRRKIIVLGDG